MTESEIPKKSNVVELFAQGEEHDDSKHPIIAHFFNYFQTLPVLSDEHKQACYKMRYDVYCRELQHEMPTRQPVEKDRYDEYSHACLIQHHPTQAYAGSIRVIHPKNNDHILPIEKYYRDKRQELSIDPASFQRREVAELSRIAISDMFRRRAIDSHLGAATGVLNTQSYSEVEIRCFPLIAVGLYLSAAAICRQNGIKHAFAMMDADLVRSADFIGVQCQQIGEYVDHHGLRAPYYINPYSLSSLSPAFFALIHEIQTSLSEFQ